jgi:hypothetical protein
MRGVCRYIECDDVIALVVELEFGRMVALVAIEDQELVYFLYTVGCILIKVLDKVEAGIVVSLISFCWLDMLGS